MTNKALLKCLRFLTTFSNDVMTTWSQIVYNDLPTKIKIDLWNLKKIESASGWPPISCPAYPPLSEYLQSLDQLSNAPLDHNSEQQLLFVIKLLTKLFTILDIVCNPDDQPNTESAPSLGCLHNPLVELLLLNSYLTATASTSIPIFPFSL